MKKRFFSILLVLTFSISIVGCGNAKSSNINTVEFETVTSTQAEAESVSEASVPEVKTDSKISSKGYSGSVYTLPVGSKGEEWSESQLDNYLADCKPYQDNCIPNEKGNIKVDLDKLMKDFGFEYVATNDEGYPYPENVYWKERGDLKIVATFTDINHLTLFFETPSSCALTVFPSSISHDNEKVRFRSEHMNDGNVLPKTTVVHLKAIVACLKYASQEKQIDCCRMPYPESYEMRYGTFTLSKSNRYVSEDASVKSETVYH